MTPLRRILATIALLTRLPVGSQSACEAPAEWAFPLVGALLGGIILAVDTLGRELFPPGGANWVVLTAWITVTGAMHLDGVVDTADGLIGHGTSARRLEIMADPRAGAFGVVAVVLVLLGKWVLLGDLDGSGRVRALFVAPFLARGILPLALLLAPPARPHGMAVELARRTGRAGSLVSVGITVVAALLVTFPAGLVLVGAGLLVVAVLALWSRVALGGFTGDILGASVEAVELFALLAAAALIETKAW